MYCIVVYQYFHIYEQLHCLQYIMYQNMIELSIHHINHDSFSLQTPQPALLSENFLAIVLQWLA